MLWLHMLWHRLWLRVHWLRLHLHRLWLRVLWLRLHLHRLWLRVHTAGSPDDPKQT